MLLYSVSHSRLITAMSHTPLALLYQLQPVEYECHTHQRKENIQVDSYV